MNNNEINLINTFSDFVINNKNFSFLRFGDAELLCMHGKTEGRTKDLHNYSTELGNELLNALKKFVNRENVFLGKWDRNACAVILNSYIEQLNIKNLCSFHILSSESDYVNQHQYNFYKTLKESNRKKVFVAHEGLKKMSSFLNSDEMILIPKINAFNEIEKIKEACLQSYEPNSIYIYCAGMNTKVLIGNTLEKFKDTTHLDIGSAYEPFVNNITRSKHMNSPELNNFYKDLL